MAVNPVDDYLNNLRGISEQAGQQKIRTLAVQFQDTLLQLPALKAEIDFMLSQGSGVDYDVLAKQLETALEEATSLMFDISMLPAHIYEAGSMQEFVERLRATLKMRTVGNYVGTFTKLCDQIERDRAAEQQRQEAEAKARAEAEALAQQEADAAALANANARAEVEEKAKREVEAKARAEAKAKAEAEERIRKDAEEKAKFDAIEKARKGGIVLIKGGRYRYSVTRALVEVSDLCFSCYPVTNKKYRLFIDYLEGKTPMLEEHFACSRFEDVLASVAKSSEWDGRESRFSSVLDGAQRGYHELFRSTYNYDPKHNGDDQPVVGLSWYSAKAYCLWLSLVESCGSSREIYRLPTEQEWEWAASGGTRKYPWGDNAPGNGLANYDELVGHTTPVGTYPKGATPDGLFDMGGNVWEWQENWYDSTKQERALRGGSWYFKPEYLPCRVRYSNIPGGNFVSLGFRVVRSITK
jgi:formylglycine-generating enzyme required for sulfatase activity